MSFLPSGRGDDMPRVEVARLDELPAGVPAEARPEDPNDRGERGKFAPGNSLAREGGKARAGKARLAERLGLGKLPVSQSFASYKRAASSWRRAQCAALAASVGAGYIGPGPSACVASAALQLAWSRYLFDIAAAVGGRRNDTAMSLYGVPVAELLMRASRLANDSRQNLLAAHELCAREAMARRGQSDPLADLNRRLGIGEPSAEEP